MKLQGYELSTESGYPQWGLIVTLYQSGNHRVPLAETHTNKEGRWYFLPRNPGTFDVCVQRVRDDGTTSTKWIMGLRVLPPRRYLLRRGR